jgi:hypothetical protein
MSRRLAALLSFAFIGVGCSGSPTTGPSQAAPAATSPAATTVVTPEPTPRATPTAFTSPLYKYSVTLPAGFTATPASEAWDGIADASHESANSDHFVGPMNAIFWGFAGPTAKDLEAYTQERIADTARHHGDTCPPKPELNQPTTIGGEPGVLLAWNCGILINAAVTVRGGVAYNFVMRDFYVKAATDPTDAAAFQALLDSVTFPS